MLRTMICISVLITSLAVPASALEFSLRGSTVVMSGPVKPGDGVKFEEFMRQADAANARTFVLNSNGGSIGNAMIIARYIRRNSGTTVADGKTVCESACTVIFAAGTRRHYINAGNLQDRLAGARGGLGYHEGNNANADGRGVQQSGQATASMINAYYEFGASSASQFATKAGFKGMYRISGKTALSNGIATSLAAP
jgi:hypothetical protein